MIRSFLALVPREEPEGRGGQMWTVTITTQKQDERITFADPTFQCSSVYLRCIQTIPSTSSTFSEKQDSTKTGVPIAPGALRESGLCALGAMSGSPDKVGDMGEGCLKNMEN